MRTASGPAGSSPQRRLLECLRGSWRDIDPAAMSSQQSQPRAPPAAAAPAAPSPGVIGFLRHQVKHRPSLIPLFLIMGTAVAGAGLYLMRLALFCPEVRWDKKNNPEPWNNLDATHRYKFFAVNMDYSKLQKDRPDF